MVCFGGEYSKGQSNLPYRGLDSGYSNRWCSNAEEVTDIDDKLTGYVATSEKCDHYTAEEVTQIPKMADNVKEAINFLGKDDDGFFMMYEQGDVSTFGRLHTMRMLIPRFLTHPLLVLLIHP